MKWLSSSLTAIVLAAAVAAQTPPPPDPKPQPPPPPAATVPHLTLPETVTGKSGAWIIIPAKAENAGFVKWVILTEGLSEVPLAALFGEEWSKTSTGRVFTADSPGVYKVLAYAAGDNRVATEPSVCRVTVTGPPPPPTPPGPTPPGPTPPGPSPIPSDGLRALIVYETSLVSLMPPSQQTILYSPVIRGYLDTHCVKGPDGKTAEWRVWDQNVPTGAVPKVWQDLMSLKRDKVPWLVVTNGKAAYQGPLPPTVDETLTLLKQYGGN